MNPIDPHMIHKFSIGNDEYESNIVSEFYEEENQREEYVRYLKNGVEVSFKEFSDAIDYYNNNPQNYLDALSYEDEFKKNQFLQLLNKDNNWVTFFIKSIIQDSAKKGYEKVLFPKGETAAKVEGHETIADELKKINQEIEEVNELLNKNKEAEIEDGGYAEGTIGYNKIHIMFPEELQKLEKRKAELKSQGIEKLKPIEAFYEIKVGNILEKQFGKDNVKTITDGIS